MKYGARHRTSLERDPVQYGARHRISLECDPEPRREIGRRGASHGVAVPRLPVARLTREDGHEPRWRRRLRQVEQERERAERARVLDLTRPDVAPDRAAEAQVALAPAGARHEAR